MPRTRQLQPPCAVRAALAEGLRRIAHHLEQQDTALVAVVVAGDDAPARGRRAPLDGEAELCGRLLGGVASRQAGAADDQIERPSPLLVLMVVPLAAPRAGDLHRQAAVAPEAQLRARRQRPVGLAQQAPGDLVDALVELPTELGQRRRLVLPSVLGGHRRRRPHWAAVLS